MKNIYIALGIVVSLFVGGLVGYAIHPTQANLAGASPAGTTSTLAPFLAVVVNLANTGANGTSTSITNNTANDYYITSIKLGCNGVGTSKTAYTGTGLSTLTLSVGTTSAANSPTIPGNLVGGGSITISTSTLSFGISSSTVAVPGTGQFGIIWAAGAPLDFWFNATNTAVCTVGVETMPS